VSGVEGYVESAASGLLAGMNAARLALGRDPVEAPRATAIGALAYYVSHADSKTYQPTNITFGIMPPLEPVPGRRPSKGADRNVALAERALAALEAWRTQTGAAAAPADGVHAARG
jgi:methylenetetrahydrofolate--tRNA-(uracil-5-)-methyltransferase